MRGIRPPCVLLPKTHRITPAHAGNTLGELHQKMANQDHPRACGEYQSQSGWQCPVRGSPPRMRGIQIYIAGRMGLLRITPAHAGNTGYIAPYTCAVWDHPRACGEYITADLHHTFLPGSPPRMRGIPYSPCFPFQPFGITPAHAGNTDFCTGHDICEWDHPRACGEYRCRCDDCRQ